MDDDGSGRTMCFANVLFPRNGRLPIAPTPFSSPPNSLSHQSAFIIEQLQLRFHNWIFHFGGGLLSSNRFLWEGFQPLPITDLLIPVLHFLFEIWGAAGQIFGTKMLSFWWFCLWWESQRSQKGFGMPEWLHLISKCRSTILKACH